MRLYGESDVIEIIDRINKILSQFKAGRRFIPNLIEHLIKREIAYFLGISYNMAESTSLYKQIKEGLK